MDESGMPPANEGQNRRGHWYSKSKLRTPYFPVASAVTVNS